ncbi:MAG: 2-succinyl-5-enolpyruvyl-6-hydroxy-3-cyclohexene-1-carboxylic-acid synthase [Prevotella sp.]|nr:2-succinyl-5-enolpyruvyl-6-hydroxy-3-cyclohexene-1-carboxylic-acid synthase [Prevotella sp.]
MYLPKYKTFQFLIPLLKAHNIRNIVISPGSRMREFVLAVEEDPFFKTYNVTDERSASYFALGMSQQLNEPVVITCTSSTATTNYVPGVTEAFYQNVQLIVLTGDRDPYMLGQQEDQMIDQIGMYDKVVRKSVTLPIVKDDFDSWYCQRLINEALLELDHHKKGPVHINVPVPAVITWNDDKEIADYPEVKAVKRIGITEKYTDVLSRKLEELGAKKRILVLAGQKQDDSAVAYLSDFFSKYNCVIHAEHMGNVDLQEKLNLVPISGGLSSKDWDDFLPDLIISFNGTLAISRNMKETLRRRKCEHWLIDESGELIDAYRNLTTIFECTPKEFFDYFNAHAESGSQNDKKYYNQWVEAEAKYELPSIPYSNLYAVKSALEHLPENIILHLSILNSIRLSQYFELPKYTKVYANVGTDGIDGCMSSFFGQACVTDKECFLFIGDLSFFYDMSSIRIKHNKGNAHILLINNHGGNEFYLQPIMPTTDQGLGAKHNNSAKGWVESCGFRYLTASNQGEFDNNIKEFVKENQEKPVVFEVFTDQMVDKKAIEDLMKAYRLIFNQHAAAKQAVKTIIGEDNIKGLKKLFGRK